MNRRNVLLAAMVLAVTMAVGDARADQCSSREALPSCVDKNIQWRSYWVMNICDYRVTLFVDVDDDEYDHRIDLEPTEERFRQIRDPSAQILSVECCPQYNRCS